MVGAWFRATTLCWSPAISVGIWGMLSSPDSTSNKVENRRKIIFFQPRPGEHSFIHFNVDNALQLQVVRIVSPIPSATDTSIRDQTTR